MPITIEVLDTEATINGSQWRCNDKGLLELLKMKATEAIFDYTPWPDYTLAEMAAKALGGRIIEATDPPEYVEGRVY